MACHLVCFAECPMCISKDCVFCCWVNHSIYVRSNWLIVLFISPILLLIFCFIIISVTEWILKSLTITSFCQILLHVFWCFVKVHIYLYLSYFPDTLTLLSLWNVPLCFWCYHLPLLLFSGWVTSDSLCVCVCVRLFCNSVNCSPLSSSVPGIFQARIMELDCHFFLEGIFPTQESNPHL